MQRQSLQQAQYSLIFILLIFLNFFGNGMMQRQRVDGGGNSKSNFIQQQPPQRFQQQYQQNQQQQYQNQQQQQPKYYNYENGINDHNGRSTQWYYFPQQQENYFPQQYNPQQNVNQQQQYYSYSSPSSTSFASHAHGVPQVQAAQGAGGQYGSINAIGSGSQFQPIQFGQQTGGAAQQLTQFREHSMAAGQQILTADNKGGINSQVANNQIGNNQSPNSYSYTTFPPLTLPSHPPTFATMMPSFFPTPPPQPVYDHALAQRMHKLPYLYNFDFAPGTPVIYCAYGANPIPRYNTPYKKCIPYHPLCGITFTCIFDVDPETGHVWNHAAETKKRK